MDIVFIQKLLTHLAYPTGLIGLMLVMAFISRVFSLRSFAKKCLWLTIIVFIISSNSFFAAFLTNGLENQYPQFSIESTPKADVIIVLGGSLAPPAQPRKFAQFTDRSNRFWLAAELFKAGKAKQVLLTGGHVFEQNDLAPEAIYIRDKLIEMGIPKSAIITEISSRTTRENATETKKLLDKISAKSALLVTSAIHMPRSIQLFTELDINIIPAPSDKIVTNIKHPLIFKLIPNAHAMELTTQALHEYYGIAADKFQRLINDIL